MAVTIESCKVAPAISQPIMVRSAAACTTGAVIAPSAPAVPASTAVVVKGALSSESILLWHFRSFADKREHIAEWEADEAAPPIVRLRSPRMTDEWLAALRDQRRPR